MTVSELIKKLEEIPSTFASAVVKLDASEPQVELDEVLTKWISEGEVLLVG